MKTINQLIDLIMNLNNFREISELAELEIKLLKAKMEFGGRTKVENTNKILETIKKYEK